MRRRTILRWGVAFGIVGVAGCSSADPSDDADPAGQGDTPDDTSASSPTPTPRPTPSPTVSPETGASPTPPTASPSPVDNSPTGTPEPSPTPTPAATPEADLTVEVAPDGRFRFDPETFEVDAGAAVAWVWRAGGHNVKPDTVPDESGWAGTPGGEFDTFESGYRYSHTFDVPGDYEYYCAPHRSSGMVGSFTVRS